MSFLGEIAEHLNLPPHEVALNVRFATDLQKAYTIKERAASLVKASNALCIGIGRLPDVGVTFELRKNLQEALTALDVPVTTPGYEQLVNYLLFGTPVDFIPSSALKKALVACNLQVTAELKSATAEFDNLFKSAPSVAITIFGAMNTKDA